MIAQADPQQQTAFKKIAEHALARDIDIGALDEVHFQQHGSRRRMWVLPKCKDLVVFHRATKKSIGYFGAIRLRDGMFAYRQEEKVFNAETFWSFMKKLRQINCHAGRRVIMLSDNARYHHAKLQAECRQQQQQSVRKWPYWPPPPNRTARTGQVSRSSINE